MSSPLLSKWSMLIDVLEICVELFHRMYAAPGSPDCELVFAEYGNTFEDIPFIPDVPLVPDEPDVPELPLRVEALIVCNCPTLSIVRTKVSLDWVSPEKNISPALPSFILLTPFVLMNISSVDV